MLLLYSGFGLGKSKQRADERTRTADLLITSELLYQLSYVGLLRCVSISQGDQAFTRLSLMRTAPERTMSLLFFVDEWGPEGRGCGEGCGDVRGVHGG